MVKVGPVVLVASAILMSLIAAAAGEAAPQDPSRLALVFPPWWTATRAAAAAAAAGEIVDFGALPFIVLVHGAPGAATRAHDAGAVLVLAGDPRSLCSSRPLERAF